MNKAFAIFAIALSALLVACGGSDDTADTVPARTASSSSPGPAATVTSIASSAATPGATPTPAPEPEPQSEKLTPALLTLDEMPPGWSPSSSVNDTADEDGICGKPDVGLAVASPARADVSFQQGEFGPFFAYAIAQYKGSDARKAMDYLKDQLAACAEWTETNDDGTTTTWKLSPISFPKVGDETLVVRMSTVVPFFGPAQTDLVFWRRGNVVQLAGYVSIGPGGASPLEDLVKRADDKARKELRLP